MPAYHSHFNETDCRTIADLPLLPIKTDIRGPAPSLSSEEDKDIIEEAIFFFRANVLFKNFEILGDADRLLVYLTFAIQEVRRLCSPVNGARVTCLPERMS